MTEVTKEDREAAERWGTGPVYSISLCAESFARHREASTEVLQTEVEALRAENARLREALEQIAETPNNGWMIARAHLERQSDD